MATDKTKVCTKIYDMHTHIFPSKIAEKAVASIGNFYDIKMTGGGTAEMLEQSGKDIGVDKYLVCSTATTAHQVEAINNFVAYEKSLHPEFIAFGSLHPDYENVEAEVDRMISIGLQGIKLHPDFQDFNIDDPKAETIYKAAEGKLPILFHMGDYRYDRTAPTRLLNIMNKYPNLICIGAHLGGYRRWEEAESLEGYLGNPNLYIDTCSALMFLDAERAVNIIRRHGIDRVFFGTDFPMWSHESELARFMALPLSDEEREKIFYKNAEAFLERVAVI